ncbi:MAG TPA: SIMPL domain-containing protein [Patescibacteria group bacterium]|nr:SIMPL domain-containing protein [Patescibacteria group bacterium]
MKNLAGAVVIFFLSLFVYTKFVGAIPFSLTSVVTNKTDSFTVTGEGKATAVPDVAIVGVGVQGQGNTVKQVQQDLNSKMNKITDAVKKVGIDAADIQTSNYSIAPTYDYQASTPRITGYQASSDLTIKVRNMDNANQVVDSATANGANQVGGITFDVSDKTKVENDARQVAVAQAKKKAADAAKAGGFTLGRVIDYSENEGGQPRPVPMLAKADMAAGSTAVTAPTQIEPGSSEITIDVSLSYEIR